MKKMVQINYLSDMDRIFDNNHGRNPKYFAPIDMKMEIGDIVLVERYDGAMTLGQVKNIHENAAEPVIRSTVFNVLDVITDSCSTFQQKYNDVARERIKKEIDERVRKLGKLKVYEAYAQHDDELKELLDEFKEIGGFSE